MSTLEQRVAGRERPILFRGEMVRAILDGQKTQTRRVVKRAEITAAAMRGIMGGTGPAFGPCPYGEPGDRLWVRETWASLRFHRDWETGYTDDWEEAANPRTGTVVYDADPHGFDDGGFTVKDRGFRWRPSIFMPRWASRLSLEIESVRVERLQGISAADAWAEGVRPDDVSTHAGDGTQDANDPEGSTLAMFALLWDEINKARGYSWESNPWVWVLTFRSLTPAKGQLATSDLDGWL